MRSFRPILAVGLLLGLACSGQVTREAAPQPRPDPKPIQRSKDGAFESAPGDLFEIHRVRDAVARGAVCNDGTAATFFVSPGQGKNAANWVVFLKGGGACVSVEHCRERQGAGDGFMMTAYGRHRGPDDAGILSATPKKNPGFWDWTRVWVPYCSSDLWVGDREASDKSGGFHFRGHRIAMAVLADLQGHVEGLGDLSEADTLLFSGGSAGAAGVNHMLDEVAGMFPDVRVLGLSDSSGIKPRDVGGVTQEKIDINTRRAAFWNAQLDASCVASGDPPKCLESHTFPRYVETPRFLYRDQYDSAMLRDAGGVTRHSDRGREVAAEIRRGLAAHPWGAFSTTAGIHVLSVKDNFTAMKVTHSDGKRYSMSDVLSNWVYDRPGPKTVIANPAKARAK